MSQQQKIRRMIMTASVTAITATGAWYGAGIKTNQQIKQEIKTRREATPMAKIAQLEEARGGLVVKKLGLERKMAELEARQGGATRSEAASGRERR